MRAEIERLKASRVKGDMLAASRPLATDSKKAWRLRSGRAEVSSGWGGIFCRSGWDRRGGRDRFFFFSFFLFAKFPATGT